MDAHLKPMATCFWHLQAAPGELVGDGGYSPVSVLGRALGSLGSLLRVPLDWLWPLLLTELGCVGLGWVLGAEAPSALAPAPWQSLIPEAQLSPVQTPVLTPALGTTAPSPGPGAKPGQQQKPLS